MKWKVKVPMFNECLYWLLRNFSLFGLHSERCWASHSEGERPSTTTYQMVDCMEAGEDITCRQAHSSWVGCPGRSPPRLPSSPVSGAVLMRSCWGSSVNWLTCWGENRNKSSSDGGLVSFLMYHVLVKIWLIEFLDVLTVHCRSGIVFSRPHLW